MPSSQIETAMTNSHDGQFHPQRALLPSPPPPPPPLSAAAPAPAPAVNGSKGKGKKAMDSNEKSRLLQARISQLEQDAAGEKDQELEIEREVRRANRDLAHQVSKMDNMQKIEHLTKRSSELLADMRRLEKENQKSKRRVDTLQKERDASRVELHKTISLKEKLEKLCRELQRDNNKMKNENKELHTTAKHNEAHWDEKFSTVLEKLKGIQEDKDTPQKQVADVEMEELFHVRFKSLIEQYELRELHFHSQMRAKELEVQLHMARNERDKKHAETEASKSHHLQSQVQAFAKTETELRNQLNIYVDKFKQVEDTLNNSNDLFLSFRKEMEDMSKKGKRLEKENETFKRQKEATRANILNMAEERQDWMKKAESAEKKTEKLLSIIHQMQQQGRKVPPTMEKTLESCYSPSDEAEGTKEDGSDYSEDIDEGEAEEADDEVEDDDLTEEESKPVKPNPNLKPNRKGDEASPITYGPERPPLPPPQVTTNGH